MEAKYKDKFEKLTPLYERLAVNLRQALQEFLKEKDISLLTIDSRIKGWDTFCEKTKRKGYSDPFLQTEDLCGIRIICFYKSDIALITEIVKNEFLVVESQDKETLLKPDQFGYRSHHFIIQIPNSWLAAPNYRGLENLKAEVQIRTVLMHAWAEIQHKLAYKKDYQIEESIKRKFSILSAKLEDADTQFEELRELSTNYRDSLIAEQKVNKDTFRNLKSIDLDSLQAFLDYHFSDRRKDIIATSELLDELTEANMTFKDLNEILDSAVDFLIKVVELEDNANFTQTAMIRGSLYLANDRYWNYYKNKAIKTHPAWVEKEEKWIKRYNNNNA